MARQNFRLTDHTVRLAKKNGKACLLADGDGLYYQMHENGGASWLYRFDFEGRRRHMGLGSYPLISLKVAREFRDDARLKTNVGIDPIAARHADRTKRAVGGLTFKDVALQHIEGRKQEWKNSKTEYSWRSTFEKYVFPSLGNLSPQAIDTPMVAAVLQPIWNEKSETARKIRSRIETVLDHSKALALRTGDNPAKWKGTLEYPLAKNKKHIVRHHPALAYDDLPEFMHELRRRDALSARALELLILTATRTGEIIAARWEEFNLEEEMWTLPGERMKTGVEHRVPLSKPALKMLLTLNPSSAGFVFAGSGKSGHLSTGGMDRLLERLGRADITVHGFRSTFRDWCSEETEVDNNVIEMALSHAIGSKVEAAYRRGDLFEKRQRLMSNWGRYCQHGFTSGKVVNLR